MAQFKQDGLTVDDLNDDQLQFLRMAYNYEVNDSTGYVTSEEISDETVRDFYAGICFSPDDFPA